MVLSIFLILICSLLATAILIQVDTTNKKVGISISRTIERADALKIIATAAAYLRSKYGVVSGFYLAEHMDSRSEFEKIKSVIVNSSGPVEKDIWQDLLGEGTLAGIRFTSVKDLLRLTSGLDSPLKKALVDSKAKGLIENNPSRIKVYALSEDTDRSWVILLCVNVGSSWTWALIEPQGFFNYAIFLPNGLPVGTYYGDGEVIDGPAWFGDKQGQGGLGIGGNQGPRFYGRTFYRILHNYLRGQVQESDVFVGGRSILTAEEVETMRNAYQGKVYWETQLSALNKVDIIDVVTGAASITNDPVGLILTYSKSPGVSTEDLIITSEIRNLNGQDVQVVKFFGPVDGFFKRDNKRYQVEMVVPHPGPPNVPVTISVKEVLPNGTVNTYTQQIPLFNGFLGLFCDTTNSSIAIGVKDQWTTNVFMGDWTILVMGNRGRQEEQTPWDSVKIYGDVEYYSARKSSTMTINYGGNSYEVYMDPFFADGTPIPNNRNVKGFLRLTSGATTPVEIDGKTFWDAWYKKMAQSSTKDHISLITTGDIEIPWHEGYNLGQGKIRNLRLDMSIFTMYWDRNRAPGQGNQVLVPTLKVDYRNFKGLSYRIIFGSLASEAVTATWDGRKGLKEFNIFDNRLYSAKRGFSPMTGGIILEGLRLR